MKLNQLYYFQEVCRCRNFTHAAQALHISQPSLSASIKDLEEEFGIQLFFRLNKGVELSEEGEFLHRRLTVILADFDEMKREMLSMRKVKHEIEIGIPPIIGSILFPDICNKFQQVHPDISINLIDAGSVQNRKMIQEKKLDLAIISGCREQESNLNCIKINELQISCFMSKNHPFAKKECISIEELDNENLVTLQENTYLYHFIKNKFNEIHLKPNVLVRTNQMSVIRNTLTSGNAVSFLYEGLFDTDDEIVCVPLKNPVYVDIHVIWSKLVKESVGTSRFLDFISSLSEGE